MTEIGDILAEHTRTLVNITGVVQGVGFRPFVFRLATDRGLNGSVINTSAGVQIDLEGPAHLIDDFLLQIRAQAPPISRISSIKTSNAPPAGYASFKIGSSVARTDDWQPVSPDSCTCDDCLAELFDPDDRRYRYPFINCTNCGPRFTIIERLPYDRPSTTMNIFSMCPDCQAEYQNPADRRFHAEPNACPVCGPRLWLADAHGKQLGGGDAVTSAAQALKDGAILALKGLGGFQLACMATDEAAIARLRNRKRRPEKPFAVMVASVEDAASHCLVTPEERALLESVQRPIVLLERSDADLRGGGLPEALAPNLHRLGMMLPCSPLHFLLADGATAPLVMTSGNLSEEPICRTNEEAVSRLGSIADFFLLHDRGIVSAYDDSVVIASGDCRVMIRRARGYAPLPLRLPSEGEPLLATGADLKNTFCITRGDQAVVSQHIGDLKDAETLSHYERTVSLYQGLLNSEPGSFVCDSHPDYLSSAYCSQRSAGAAPFSVQHHRAHVASCLAEHGFEGIAVGVALDGTGYGDDGAIWGGEFFTGSFSEGFTRAARLEYMPLPGGETAIREPWRMALGAVWRFIPHRVDDAARLLALDRSKKDFLIKQLKAGINCPETSSFGRLFDVVAALTIGRKQISYEAQAAMELEACAGTAAGSSACDSLADHKFTADMRSEPWKISPAAVISAVIDDLLRGEEPPVIARRFHLAAADAIVQYSLRLAEKSQTDTVALSGGVFLNRMLLKLVSAGLSEHGLTVLIHQQLPPGDGCISYGQAAMAIYNIRKLGTKNVSRGSRQDNRN